jgi:hypothetical protein
MPKYAAPERDIRPALQRQTVPEEWRLSTASDDLSMPKYAAPELHQNIELVLLTDMT